MENRFHRSAKRASTEPLLVLAPSRHYPPRLRAKPHHCELSSLFVVFSRRGLTRYLSFSFRIRRIAIVSFSALRQSRANLARLAIFLCALRNPFVIPRVHRRYRYL